MPAPVVWFPSKLDWWLGVLMAVPPIASLFSLGASLADPQQTGIVVAVATLGFVVALYGLLVIPVRYGIDGENLIVRFGVVRQRIKLDAIREVTPTRNPLASPALSLDRLSVRTGEGLTATTMISPRDRDAFLSMLASVSRLQRDGDRLIRE